MANSENLLRRLRTTLGLSDAVLLVGSGVSLWSGLPTWERLLNQLADYVEQLGRDATAVRQEIKAGDLLLAASYAAHQLDLREFGSFIRQAIKYPNAKPAEIHNLIATLGPSCFITTNYDRLLETAISKSSPHGISTIVTNRQVAEIADILPSRARGFLFKYHGDVEDAASIVLTRDQYRRIQHEYPATTRAFGTLLATRPVVMIGFGLRDLDFLAIKDELVAAFEGQVGEYYAIMPDFDHVRTEYWRKTYRTEIISYDTIVRDDGSHDHSNLLDLLRSLQPSPPLIATTTHSSGSPYPSDFTLRLARLAAGIVRKRLDAPSERLPLTVSAEPTTEGFYPHYDHDLSHLLKSFKKSFLLLGLPGSGKSFALTNYAADLANALLEQCIQEQTTTCNFHIPIAVHLAVYAGDLRELLQISLPTGLDLDSLLRNEQCTVILDGVNEVPRAFVESGRWIKDYQDLISSAPNCRFILASRNETWLSSLDIARFNISDISANFVIRHFASKGRPEIEKNPELLRTLSKPLFFALASSNRIDLSKVTTPADVYESFFEIIDSGWRTDGMRPIDFATTLEGVAFGMLASGAEFAGKEQFRNALLSVHADSNTAERAISFLLAQGALFALAGHRLSFFHQSVTEYLAARVIAHQFGEDPESLRKRLEDKRWDQALFLAMSFLRPSSRQNFLEEILTADLVAAARASHYLEVEQDQIINKITLRAADQASSHGSLYDFEAEHRLEYQLQLLPYKESNINALTRLSQRSGSIGGVAAGMRFRIAESQRKTIIDEILRSHDDWNYVQSFAGITEPFWSENDLDYLLAQLHLITTKLSTSPKFGEIFFKRAKQSKLLSWCEKYTQSESAAKHAFIEALRRFDNRKARSILFNLLAMGQHEAVYPLYSNLKFAADNFERDELPVNAQIANLLARDLTSGEGEWAILLARELIERNPAWKVEFKKIAAPNASAKLILSAISADNSAFGDIVESALIGFHNLDDHSIRILGQLEFWESASDLIILKALNIRNPLLAGAVLGQVQGRKLPLLSIRPFDWWLDWAEECLASEVRAIWWCGYMIGRFINQGSDDIRAAALTMLNGASEMDFARVGRLVFSEGAGSISTEQFSGITLTRLLSEGDRFKFSATLLGNAATEEFIRTTLLPHLRENSDHGWIRKAIQMAGNRHNRRYLIDDTDTRSIETDFNT
jgi:hypothetical protein